MVDETAPIKKTKAVPGPKAVAGYRVSIIGKPRHTAGGKTMVRGEHYPVDKATADKLKEDANVVVEAVDADGKVVVNPA